VGVGVGVGVRMGVGGLAGDKNVENEKATKTLYSP